LAGWSCGKILFKIVENMLICRSWSVTVHLSRSYGGATGMPSGRHSFSACV
jgi:hypothetical protein